MRRIFSISTMLLVVSFVLVTGASAQQNYALFGEASLISPGNASNRAVRTVSDADPAYGGIDYEVPAGMTLSQLDTLATDYRTSDGCGGGSPRFVVETAEGGIYDFHFTCTADGLWHNTGNLASPVSPVDVRGTGHPFQYAAPYAAVKAQYGSETITYIYIVNDGSWFFGEQVVDFDNTNIDGTVYTYELPVANNANQCKNGGWQAFTRADGSPFKNQGDCVSYTKNGK